MFGDEFLIELNGWLLLELSAELSGTFFQLFGDSIDVIFCLQKTVLVCDTFELVTLVNELCILKFD